MITEKREEYMPFEYPWAYEAWLKQKKAEWLFDKIPMSEDINDWKFKLNEKEKNVVGNILKSFAQTETYVGDYWTSYVTKWFPKHEIMAMARAFGSMEDMHARAYSYLNEILDLTDFKAFLDDETVMNKLNVLMEVKDDKNLSNIARSLAIFSACTEGINLYSSFAVMLSFRNKNVMKGISQQMLYSIRDESLHSNMGCKLFNELIKENPKIRTKKFDKDIYEAFDLTVKNELNYIQNIFKEGDLDTITQEQLKNFIYHRANKKLVSLNLEERFPVDESLLKQMNWFYEATGGEQQTDFFAQHETNYAQLNSDWTNDWTKSEW